MSKILLEQPDTITSLAGTVPFTMNLEVFVNQISSGLEEAYAITLHLAGYSNGIRQTIGRGSIGINGPLPTPPMIMQVEFPSVIALRPVSVPLVPWESDNYDLMEISTIFGEITQPVPIPDCIGIILVKVDGELRATVVDTKITSSIMIGARNIIITDPLMPTLPHCHFVKDSHSFSHHEVASLSVG